MPSLTPGQAITLRGEVLDAPHDAVIVPDGCSAGDEIVLEYPWMTHDGLGDSDVFARMQKDPVFRKFQAFRRLVRGQRQRIVVTVTGRFDVGDRRPGTLTPLEERLSTGAFGHPIGFSRYRIVVLWLSDLVTWPDGTPRPDRMKSTKVP